MRTSPPTRLPADVYDPATVEAAASSRTVPQQIAHWARIGRQLEMSPHVNHRAIAAVLAGEESYDLLGEREQAVARAAIDERVVELRESLNFEDEFKAAGLRYVEADEAGNVIVHPAPVGRA
ncbi:MAG: TA system antitoxin ParD family protein [Marmoricola sp.]